MLSDTHSCIMLCLIYLCHCHTVSNGTGTFQKVVQLKSIAAPRGGIWEGVSPPQLTRGISGVQDAPAANAFWHILGPQNASEMQLEFVCKSV